MIRIREAVAFVPRQAGPMEGVVRRRDHCEAMVGRHLAGINRVPDLALGRIHPRR